MARRFVSEVTEEARSLLTRVPRSHSAVCTTCHGPTAKTGRCSSCIRNEAAVAHPCERVAPISLCEKGTLLYDALLGYKTNPDAGVRAEHEVILAATLARFLSEHSACIGEFDLATGVPSTRGRTPPPVARLVDRVTNLRGNIAFADDLLIPSDGRSVERTADPSAFMPSRKLEGQRVLLIDDTWVSGARAQSAAHAITTAGGIVVATIVIARLIDTDEESAAKLWKLAASAAFEFDRCVLSPH